MFSSKLRNMFTNILQPLKKGMHQLSKCWGDNYSCNLPKQNCNTLTSTVTVDTKGCRYRKIGLKKENSFYSLGMILLFETKFKHSILLSDHHYFILYILVLFTLNLPLFSFKENHSKLAR